MDESSRSAWCREHGVYPQELAAWRQSATEALAEPEEQRAVAAFESICAIEATARLAISPEPS